MGRVPMVTRTITTTDVTVLCLNVETAEPFNKVVRVPRTYSNTKKLLEKVRELAENDIEKVVHIVDTVNVEGLYGMTEAEFMILAKKLPPREKTTITEENEE